MIYLHMQVKEWSEFFMMKGFFKGPEALVPGSAGIRQHREWGRPWRGQNRHPGLHGPYSEREVRIAHRVHGLFLKLLHGFLLGIHGADDERAGAAFPGAF